MRCRAIVDLDALRSNYEALRKRTGGTAVLVCVVKADAYGHGALAVSRALAAAGARHFAVASLEEAISLRDGGIDGAILVFDGVEPGGEREAALRGIEPLVSSFGQLQRWNDAAQRLGRKLSCHLLLNTGMNSLGIDFVPSRRASTAALLDALESCEWVELRGVATHFASAEDFGSRQTATQSRLFARQLTALRAAGIRPRYVHSANSAAIAYRGAGLLRFGEGGVMVRPGLSLYGYVKEPLGRRQRRPPRLRPVLEWRARLLETRDVSAGAALGYGATFRALRRMRIGILSVGYGDGLDWRLSNRGSVAIRGMLGAIVGQISMDVTMVDLSAAEAAAVGEEAVLLGSEPYDAQGMASLIGGIPYEVLCGISKRVPRQYASGSTAR